jgi:hypothetical protein
VQSPNEVYRREVWLLLHNSESSDNETAAVRFYMDESGSRDTPKAVVGGIVINFSDFLVFEKSWEQMLFDRGIIAPLHMKEFGPNRRFGSMSEQSRRELFSEAAGIINGNKIITIAAQLTISEYESCLPEKVKDKFSVYGMCFNLAAMANHKMAEANNYLGRIPFILDVGNPYADHVRKSHKALLGLQKEGPFLHAGGLYFDDDSVFGILQAADIVAWGARRKASGQHFPSGMEPIKSIFVPEDGHTDVEWKPEWLRDLGDNLGRVIAKHEAQEKDEGGTNGDEF